MNSDNLEQLATALATAQALMKNAAFNKINPHFKSKYADLTSIREATLPALTKNGLSIIQYTKVFDGQVYLCTRLLHKSGEYIEGQYPVGGGTPQQMGSALTYAKRYGWAAMCGVTADDDDDANAAEGLPATNAKGQTSGKSKAASRSDYEALVEEMRKETTGRAMKQWWEGNVDRINALPGEWIGFLKEAYHAQIEQVQAKARAEGKPYAEGAGGSAS